MSPRGAPTAPAPAAGRPVLVRPVPAATARRALDPTQRAVVEHAPGSGPLVVLGAPGTGKTTALVEALVARVAEHDADPATLLVLAPSRQAAAALRDRVSSRIARTTTEALARTPHSYAWGVLRRAAVLSGGPPPRLLSGPEQDQIIADLLRGHELGRGHPPAWPASVPEAALRARGFRAELRDLVMRALERGVGPQRLAELGLDHGRPEWVAAAGFLLEYLQVTALGSAGAHDPAAIVQDAARMLARDPGLLAEERARWSLVAVEDHHESTAATGALVELLGGGGTDVVLLGDPDATTAGFRGGDPTLLAQAPQRFARPDGSDAPVVVLGTRWRCGPLLASTAERVSQRIGSSGVVAHRRPQPAPLAGVPADGSAGGSAGTPSEGPGGAPGEGVVEGHVLRSPAQQSAFVAGLLREEHLRAGTPWSRMAVVVRSASATSSLRRALGAVGVPVAVPVAEVPVRDEPAVRPLRTALRVVLAAVHGPHVHGPHLDGPHLDGPHPDGPGATGGPGAPGGRGPATADQAVELLTSWIGGADALALRRLRQAVLAVERADGGTRGSDALLVAAVTGDLRPERLPARAAAPAVRVRRVLDAGTAAAAVPGSTAEDALWALWSAAAVAGPWQASALAGGAAGERADRDLDAVVALFDAAARYEDRLPGSPAARFLEQLEGQDVPADTLAARSPDDDAVALLTPQGAVGLEWDVVVVPGLQDGAWPDTRLRGTLLGAPDLADLLAGRAVDLPAEQAAVVARRQVVDDERRLLHVAITRARRRIVVTAVDSEDEQPSAFLDLVSPPTDDELADGRAPTAVPRPMTLPALVAELRAVLLTPTGLRDATGTLVDADRHGEAAAHLARLAAAGVPGADPRQWFGLAALSDDAPLRDPDEPVRVSPSAVESFQRCGLRWLLETSGGRPVSSASQGLGVLVHQIAEELPEGTEAVMRARLVELWPSLGLPPTWIGAKELRLAQRLVGKLARYVAEARAAGRSVVAVEADVEVAIGRALVRGRLDRVERDADGGLRVVDLKTGSHKPAADELPTHPQLGLYQAVVEAGGLDEVPGVLPEGASGPARSSGAVLVQLGGTTKGVAEQVQPALSQADDPAWARRLVEETAERMAASSFVAVENPLCPTCPVRTSCPVHAEGRSVVGEPPPDDPLPGAHPAPADPDDRTAGGPR